MKKIAILALLGAAVFGTASVEAQEVSYVEDCSQGVLVGKMKDNWFITAQGGANIFFSGRDHNASFTNRIGASANIMAGKWFTPVWGFRFGVSANIDRGATVENGAFRDYHNGVLANTEHGVTVYPERLATLGPRIELMLSLTNWLCGYNPNRLYNAVLHGGGGGYWTFYHGTDNGDHKWRNAWNRTLFVDLGVQNNFQVSKHFDVFFDVTSTVMDYTTNEVKNSSKWNKDITMSLALEVGFTYKFNKTGFDCPVTAVCPTWKYTDAEGDALVARLANADNKIKDLQRQLDDCLKRPVKDCACENALATIYYPINDSSLSARETTLLGSIAETMKANPDKKYILTGWADNYTGNDEINTRLRNERVNGVKDCLVKAGVPESQLETRINAGNLTDYGFKRAQFDRAVTIVEAE